MTKRYVPDFRRSTALVLALAQSHFCGWQGGYPNVSPSAPPAPQQGFYAAPVSQGPLIAQAVPVQGYQQPVAYAPSAQLQVLQPGAPQQAHVPIAQTTVVQPVLGQAVVVQGGMGGNGTYSPQALAAARAIMTHELFGCDKDIGTCCLACCCPCVVFGQNKEMAGQDFGTNCMIHGFMIYCFGAIGGALVACQPRMQLMKTVHLAAYTVGRSVETPC